MNGARRRVFFLMECAPMNRKARDRKVAQEIANELTEALGPVAPEMLTRNSDVGPKGEKRPADVIGAAVMIGKIATGEIEDLTTDEGKNAAAVALGRMGGKARAAGMTAKKRKEIAKKAADRRWGK
jgi:hypothetical protein